MYLNMTKMPIYSISGLIVLVVVLILLLVLVLAVVLSLCVYQHCFFIMT